MRNKKLGSAKTYFKKGHTPYNKGWRADPLNSPSENRDDRQTPVCKWKRMDKNLYMDTAVQAESGIIEARDVSGRATNVKFLRPQTSPTSSEDSIESTEETATNRLLNLAKTEQLWNHAFKEHMPCGDNQLKWDLKNAIKWGLGWKMALTCTCGQYVSKVFKLYEEVDKLPGERGPKAAACNVQLQVGLSHGMGGNTSARNTLMAMNVPPPTPNAMQKSCNKISKLLTDVNLRDMAREREAVRDVLEARGLPRDTAIPIEGDARYNNELRSAGGKTPMQPGTQAMYTMRENITKKKGVVSLIVVNKLCSQYRKHPGKCGPGVCSVTYAEEWAIGDEKAHAAAAYEQMEGDTQISHMTTDGDSKAVQGVQERQEKNIEHLRDTRHLGSSLKKAVTNSSFSKTLFGKRTVKQYERVKREFANNVQRRVAAEFDKAHKKSNGDTELLISELSYTIDCIIACYFTECGTLCKKYSKVCSGSKRRHWNHSSYLAFTANNELSASSSDTELLRKALAIRLSRPAVLSQYLNTNTQASEAINRAYSRANPKIVTRSRNAEGRTHGVATIINQGIFKATLIQCEAAGAPLNKKTSVAKALKSEARAVKKRRRYDKTIKAKTQRGKSRQHKYKIYNEKLERETYEKNLLDTIKYEHSYGLRRCKSNILPDHQLHDHNYPKKKK